MAITSNCAEIIITNPQGSVSFNKLITTTELSPAKTIYSEDRVYLIQNSENEPQTFWWNLEKAIADGYADLEELYDYFVAEIANQCGVGGGTWGSITGTLSNQTDLQSALNAKLADSDAGVGARINASASATPNDTDLVATAENAGLLKKITWTSVKAFLKTYFDTIYQTILVSGTSIKTINFTSLLGAGDISITPNATHTGEVTGATTLTVDKTAITNKTAVTIDVADYVLISDSSDSGNLKKGLVSDLGGFDDGDFTLVASFKSLYNY